MDRYRAIPLWLRIAYTAWMVLWVPSYAGHYGPQNFLWLCDIANFIVLLALWTGSRLLISSQLVAVLLIGFFWTVDAGIRLVTGSHLIGGTEYMFEAASPLYIRLLSLFHIFVPLLLLYAFLRIGYDRRGIRLQTVLTCAILPLTYFMTDPLLNINWVFGPFGKIQDTLDPLLYLGIVMTAYPVLLYLPTHHLILFIQRRFLKVR